MLNWKVDYLSKIVEFDLTGLTGVFPTIFPEMHFRWGPFSVDCFASYANIGCRCSL